MTSADDGGKASCVGRLRRRALTPDSRRDRHLKGTGLIRRDDHWKEAGLNGGRVGAAEQQRPGARRDSCERGRRNRRRPRRRRKNARDLPARREHLHRDGPRPATRPRHRKACRLRHHAAVALRARRRGEHGRDGRSDRGGERWHRAARRRHLQRRACDEEPTRDLAEVAPRGLWGERHAAIGEPGEGERACSDLPTIGRASSVGSGGTVADRTATNNRVHAARESRRDLEEVRQEQTRVEGLACGRERALAERNGANSSRARGATSGSTTSRSTASRSTASRSTTSR